MSSHEWARLREVKGIIRLKASEPKDDDQKMGEMIALPWKKHSDSMNIKWIAREERAKIEDKIDANLDRNWLMDRMAQTASSTDDKLKEPNYSSLDYLNKIAINKIQSIETWQLSEIKPWKHNNVISEAQGRLRDKLREQAKANGVYSWETPFFTPKQKKQIRKHANRNARKRAEKQGNAHHADA